MFITAAQTLQMFVGAAVIVVSSYETLLGNQCETHIYTSIFGLGIYISYLILFGRFFYFAYIGSSDQNKALKKAN